MGARKHLVETGQVFVATWLRCLVTLRSRTQLLCIEGSLARSPHCERLVGKNEAANLSLDYFQLARDSVRIAGHKLV